ncbi:MAG: ABC transporter permease [Bowdeniella nasicola]|nr:ABC transporter permease [Bowdeniella nasicola]
MPEFLSAHDRDAATASTPPRRRAQRIFPLRFFVLELRRIGRDYTSMFFIAILPAFLYVIFGAAQDYSDLPMGRGNVAMYVMIGMAAYGAVTATTGIGGQAAVERQQGWGRQLALTPLSDIAYVCVKTLVSAVIAIIPVALIFLIGAWTSASAPGWVWAASGAVIVAGALMFALYGLAFGLAFRTESAVSAASGSLVILGFLGNTFVVLSGTMLTVAKFTPLFGITALARWPLTDGAYAVMDRGPLPSDPLWVPLLNVTVWLIIFGVTCLILVRRSRGRE